MPGDEEVLVRVHAAALNIADWYDVVGRPYVGRTAMGLRKPKEERLGIDFAGTVEAVGKDVTQFRPGDEVFGAEDRRVRRVRRGSRGSSDRCRSRPTSRSSRRRPWR